MSGTSSEKRVGLQPWQLPASPFAAVDSVTGFLPSSPLLHIAKHNLLATTVGNAVKFYGISPSGDIGCASVLWGRDGGGVGALALHPSGDVIAVAERLGDIGTGANGYAGPNIYLYDVLTGALVAQPLSGGTERAYADVNFNSDGSLLVSVGGFPDFSLTVWDITPQNNTPTSLTNTTAATAASDTSSMGMLTARVVLRTKAFGREVLRARFSPSAGRLISSGSSHIRFWRMAHTFTGRKLQGDTGKFGKVDLSDVADFAELADGKVVSTSEAGHLLLWEGNVIKCQIGRLRAKTAAQLLQQQQDGTHTLHHAHSQASTEGSDHRTHGNVSARSGRSSLHEEALGLRDDDQAEALSLANRFDFIPAHDGPVHCVLIDAELNVFISAGDDGRIRWFDLRFIDTADTSDEFPIPCFEPLFEYEIPTAPPFRGHGHMPAKPRKIIKLRQQEADAEAVNNVLTAAGIPSGTDVPDTARSHGSSVGKSVHHAPTTVARAYHEVVWLVADANGVLWAMTVVARITTTLRKGVQTMATDLACKSMIAVMEGHATGITGVLTLPPSIEGSDDAILTAGADGTIREWISAAPPADIVVSNRLAGLKQSAALAQAAVHTPSDHEGVLSQVAAVGVSTCKGLVVNGIHTLVAGFVDGSLRAFARGHQGFVRLSATKPHSQPIVYMEVSPDTNYLVTASCDSTLFFFAIDKRSKYPAFLPIGFITLTDAQNQGATQATAIAWSPDSRRLYVGCSDTYLRRLTIPAAELDDPERTLSAWPRLEHTFEMPDLVSALQNPSDETAVFPAALLRLRLKTRVVKTVPPVDASKEKGKKAESSAPATSPEGSPQSESKEAFIDDQPDVEVSAATPATPTMDVHAKLGSITAITVLDSDGGNSASYFNESLLLGCAGEVSSYLYEVEVSTAPGGAKVSRSGKVALTAAELAAMLGGSQPVEEATDPAEAVTGLVALEPTAMYPIAPLLRGENVTPAHPTVLCYVKASNVLLVGLSDGSVAVKSTLHRGPLIRMQLHDGKTAVAQLMLCDVPEARKTAAGSIFPESPSISSLRRVYSVARDGSLITCLLDVQGFISACADVLDALILPVMKTQPIDHSWTTPYSGVIASALLDVIHAMGAAGRIQDEACPTIPRLADGLNAPSAPHVAAVDLSDAADLAAGAYSIEEDKQRSEADARLRDAESEKTKVRRKVATLREAFSNFRRRVEQEAAEHPSRSLTEADLVIDPAMVQRLHAEGEKQLDEVDNEFAYDIAKRRVMLNKLVKRYLADVELDDLTVRAFMDPSICVSTLRTQSLSGALLAAATTANSVAEEQSVSQAVDPVVQAAARAEKLDGNFSVETVEGKEDAGHGSTAAFEERRRARLQRKGALEALAGKRPGPNDDFPPDVAAVQWAKDNMGDYKLKGSKDYRPPPGRRVDAISKRRELVQLELHVHAVRSGFNKKVLALRQRKQVLVLALQKAQAEIEHIDVELSSGATPTILASAGVSSLPTPAALANPIASSFVLPPLELQAEEKGDNESLVSNLRNGDKPASGAPQTTTDGATSLDPYYPSVLPPLLRPVNGSDAARWQFPGAAGVPGVGALSGPPTQEEVIDALRRYTALADRKGWLRVQQANVISSFDHAVAECRRERLGVQGDCAAAAAKLLVLGQELDLLRDMSKRDAALEARLAKSKADKAAVGTNVAAYTAQLAEKRAELDALQSKEKLLLAEFDEIVGTSHTAYSQLLKIYKRKIKRAKSSEKNEDGGNEDDNGLSDDDDDLDDLGDDLGSDDEEEEETCPDACEKSTYERVLALRERRLDIDDAAAELNKAMDDIRKNSDRFSQREKTIDKELSGITAELNAFQREKQSRLNTISTVVTLRASQILAGVQPPNFRVPQSPDASPSANWYTETTPLGRLPPTIEHCVVFTRSKLRALRERIDELQNESVSLERNFKELHKDERRLINEKKRLEGEISGARQRCDELQLLKFGKVIDIDALDRATSVSTTAAAETHAAISHANNEFDAEIAVVKNAMTSAQEQLLELTRQHTKLLETIATLTARQNALEASLSGKAELAADTTALASALGATRVLISGKGDDLTPQASISSVESSGVKPLAVSGVLMPTASTASVRTQSGAVKIGMINIAALNRTLTTVSRPPAGASKRMANSMQAATMGGHSGIVVSDSAALARSDATERSKLLTTVRMQAQHIEDMKKEIASLRRKGGVMHIPRQTSTTTVVPATPVTPLTGVQGVPAT